MHNTNSTIFRNFLFIGACRWVWNVYFSPKLIYVEVFWKQCSVNHPPISREFHITLHLVICFENFSTLSRRNWRFYFIIIIFHKKQALIQKISRSFPQLLNRHVLIAILCHHFADGHLEILLRDVNATLSQRKHTGLRAYRLIIYYLTQ